MARRARVVVPGCPHHITHRGNRGEAVFLRTEDRITYLDWLSNYSREHGLRIWAYCLMTNHVHLIGVPVELESLERAVGFTHRRYARAINRREGWLGHLWANRFHSAPMDGAHLWTAVRYVELNPVRAALVSEAPDYRWSSARAHATRTHDPYLSSVRPFPGPIRDWHAWLHSAADTESWENLRKCTSTGRPCGSDQFVRRVEKGTGRSLAPRRRGRRRKTAKPSPNS